MASLTQIKQQAVSITAADNVLLLHQAPISWILQLDNRVLRSLIQHNAAHIYPQSFQIDVINQTSKVLTRHAILAKCLKSAGIFLTASQVKVINIENRQIYYRRLIENEALRELAKGFFLRLSRWNRAAKKQIEFLNALLGRSVVPNVLAKALMSIGITLNKEQLAAVIKESKVRQQASPYLAARNACESLEAAIAALKAKAIKRRYMGYLSLIINESALSDYSVEELKMEIRSKIEDPYLLAVKNIREQAAQLLQKKDVLLAQDETPQRNKLIQKIEKTLAILERVSYRSLMKQQWILEKWVSANTVSDRLHGEIAALAPKRVLCNGQANRLYEKLHRKSLRTLGMDAK